MSRPADFDEVLSKIPGAKQHGDGWTAACPLPGHRTPARHLTLKDAGEKALITDQGGRHTYEDLCAWLGFSSLSYRDNGRGGLSPSVKGVSLSTVST